MTLKFKDVIRFDFISIRIISSILKGSLIRNLILINRGKNPKPQPSPFPMQKKIQESRERKNKKGL